MSQIKQPNPGSEKAKERGCKCPVIDNHYGRGFKIDGETQFIISGACPLHSEDAEFFQKESERLLNKLPNLTNAELEGWNIEAQTLLTFEAIRNLNHES